MPTVNPNLAPHIKASNDAPATRIVVAGLLTMLAPSWITLAMAAERFTVSADGQAVRDEQLALIWRRCPEGMAEDRGRCAGSPLALTHTKAREHAANESARTGVHWRLPTPAELAGLAERRQTTSPIDPLAFPDTPQAVFWSSSAHEGFGFYGGGVPVSYANVPYFNRERFRFHLRLVRSP